MGPRHLDEHIEMLCLREQPLIDEAGLAALWRQAGEEYKRLSDAEPGAADNPGLRALPARFAAKAEALLAAPAIRNTFTVVPVSLCLVELDRMVVSQYSLTVSTVEQLSARWKAKPGPAQVFDTCMPVEPPDVPIRLAYKDHQRFEFVCDSHDVRFIGAQLLRADEVPPLGLNGYARAVVALAVGFSVNVLNAVRYNGRVVLNNGNHRAYALRRAGVTHVPCLVQACDSMEDVRHAATHEVYENADLYFEHPRPPLLRDFDNPRLSHSFEVPRLRRHIALQFDSGSRMSAL